MATSAELSNQRDRSLGKNRLAGIISGFYDPHKSSGSLFFSAYPPIPALLIGRSAEYHLTPTIENAEVFQFADPYSDRPEKIISSIPVRSESGRYKDLGIGTEYLNRYKGRIEAVVFIRYDYLIFDAVKTAVIKTDGVFGMIMR